MRRIEYFECKSVASNFSIFNPIFKLFKMRNAAKVTKKAGKKEVSRLGTAADVTAIGGGTAAINEAIPDADYK